MRAGQPVGYVVFGQEFIEVGVLLEANSKWKRTVLVKV